MSVQMHSPVHTAAADQVARVQPVAETWTPQHVLTWAFDTFGSRVAISSAFGAEGMVLIDMASRSGKRFPSLHHRHGIPVSRNLFLDGPDRREVRHHDRKGLFDCSLRKNRSEFMGNALWTRDPDQCCNLRKVEPLRRKLAELSAWITSIRRDQTSVRSSARRVEWDAKFGLVKINPIVDWTSKQVWRYIHDHDVPYNALHDQDYPSIGCTHCTRAVRPGEDPRAGRWSGFAKTECGLHIIEPAPTLEGRQDRKLSRVLSRLAEGG